MAVVNEGGNVRIGFENNTVSLSGHLVSSYDASVVSFVEAADNAVPRAIEITQ